MNYPRQGKSLLQTRNLSTQQTFIKARLCQTQGFPKYIKQSVPLGLLSSKGRKHITQLTLIGAKATITNTGVQRNSMWGASEKKKAS